LFLGMVSTRVPDIRQRFLFRGALGPAAGEARTGDAESFFRLF
jgi:hypothetical protein